MKPIVLAITPLCIPSKAGDSNRLDVIPRTLLALAERKRFQFVVLFIHQDYDRLWDTIKATAPELFMAWRDCGLLDEHGHPRPSYTVWREYFGRPLDSGQ